jgi:hypothetical protein
MQALYTYLIDILDLLRVPAFAVRTVGIKWLPFRRCVFSLLHNAALGYAPPRLSALIAIELSWSRWHYLLSAIAAGSRFI